MPRGFGSGGFSCCHRAGECHSGGLTAGTMAFTAADGIEDKRRTSLFVEDPNTGKGWVLRPSRKRYILMPSETDFN